MAGSVNLRAIGGVAVSGANVIDPPTSAVRVILSSAITVTAIQGPAPWSQTLTDGAHGPVAVTPPFIGASAANPSLVVSLSPVTPLPAGTNVLGAITGSGVFQTSGIITAGTLTANVGTTGGLALDTSVNGLLLAQGARTGGQSGPLVQGAVTAFGPVYAHGQTSPFSLTLQGALRVDATATTQPVSGAVSATTPDVVGTPGTLNGLNTTAQVTLSGHPSVGAVIAAGSLSATLVPELSFDGGATWVATWFDQSNRTKVTSLVLAKPNPATSVPIVVMGGATHARVRVSVYTTGTAQATLTATTGFDLYALWTAPAGTPAPPTNVAIGGIANGTTMIPLRTTSDGRLLVFPSNSVMEAAPQKITDGIRGPVAVTSAFQPASPTDPALVVTLSPMSAFRNPATPILQKWARPSPIYTVLSTELNGLGSATMSATSGPIWGQNLYWDCVLTLASLSPAAGAFIAVYVLEAVNDSTFPAPSDADLRNQPSQLLFTLGLGTTVTTAQTIVVRQVLLPPHAFRVKLDNQSGVALNASGNTLQCSDYSLNLNG